MRAHVYTHGRMFALLCTHRYMCVLGREVMYMRGDMCGSAPMCVKMFVYVHMLVNVCRDGYMGVSAST